MAKVAILRKDMSADLVGSLKSYQIGIDEYGEPVNKFKYMPGVVRQYRFDAKEGKFKLNLGGDNLKDMGRTIKFRPIAWRLFYDPNLFNMGPKDWAEIFFIDEKNAVSAVLFHGYSVDNLNALIGPLYFDDLMLSDVVLTITAEKKTRQTDNGTYYIAGFSYEGADLVDSELKDFLSDMPIYRDETLTEVSQIKVHHGMKYVVRPHGGFNALPPAEELPDDLPMTLLQQPAAETAEQAK
jgi:hypothetical protein